MIYTLNFLAPILVTGCVNEFLSGQGDYCAIHEPTPKVKYYEASQSCYVNGIFYNKCENSPGVQY